MLECTYLVLILSRSSFTHTTSWLDHCISAVNVPLSVYSVVASINTEHIPDMMGKLKSWIWRCSQGKIFQFCSKTQMFKWCPFAWGCNYVSTVRMWATGKRLDMYNDTVSALHEGTKPYWKHKYDTCKIRACWNNCVAESHAEVVRFGW